MALDQAMMQPGCARLAVWTAAILSTQSAYAFHVSNVFRDSFPAFHLGAFAQVGMAHHVGVFGFNPQHLVELLFADAHKAIRYLTD